MVLSIRAQVRFRPPHLLTSSHRSAQVLLLASDAENQKTVFGSGSETISSSTWVHQSDQIKTVCLSSSLSVCNGFLVAPTLFRVQFIM